MVLGNTAVEVAVLESARGGIVRAGLGFTSCDIAVVTNVQNDHLGISDIETMEDLAQVKSVLVQTIKPGGWIILNANNPYTIAMAKVSKGNNAWFAISPQNTQIQLAIRKGEPVAYIENNEIIIQTGIEKIKLLPLSEVPITFNGTLGFMIENSLAACLAASQFGVPQEIIKTSLKTFYPSVAQTPGRMNLYEVQGCKLLVDFAHNPDGFAGIRDYLQKVEAPFKIGIIVGTGDRKDEDTLELGRLSAQMFDLTLIHQIKFLRGKKADELVSMLVSGMHLHNKDAKWMRIPDEAEPLAFALQQAKPGSFITALSDVLTNPEALVASLGSDRNA